MAAIGAGLAVYGAWQCVAHLMSDPNSYVREDNRGCAWIVALFAVLATGGLIDALSGH